MCLKVVPLMKPIRRRRPDRKRAAFHVLVAIAGPLHGRLEGVTTGDVINELRRTQRKTSHRRALNAALYWLTREGWLKYEPTFDEQDRVIMRVYTLA